MTILLSHKGLKQSIKGQFSKCSPKCSHGCIENNNLMYMPCINLNIAYVSLQLIAIAICYVKFAPIAAAKSVSAKWTSAVHLMLAVLTHFSWNTEGTVYCLLNPYWCSNREPLPIAYPRKLAQIRYIFSFKINLNFTMCYIDFGKGWNQAR